ncbi:MAG: site-2 protease family protein [Promethearchaeota archaeon]
MGNKYPRVWRLIWNIGIFVSFSFTIYGFYFFFNNLMELFKAPSIENVITPLIPGVTVKFSIFSYLILPILFVITIHEFSHAMAAEADGIEIKSTGIFGSGVFFIIGFGAFVEVDEFRVRSPKTKFWTKLRISAAGTFSNAIEALIAFILILNFNGLMSFSYSSEVFSVTNVVPTYEGGYNYNNIFQGDVVIRINGTEIDYQNGVTLDAILINKTHIKCKPGDYLIFNVLNSNKELVNRTIKLGHRFFLGFDYEFISNSIIKVTNIYSKFQGGNNYDIPNFSVDTEIKALNGILFNKSAGITPKSIIMSQNKEGKINATLSDDSNISLNLNYFPQVFGAYEFQSFYVGAFFEKLNNSAIIVDRVLKNVSEDGINEGRIIRGDIITKVNGVPLNLTNNKTFEDFLVNDLKVNVSDKNALVSIPGVYGGKGRFVNFTILRNSKEIITNVIFIPIPKIYVYVGIQTSPYWLPKNFMGAILGGNFPNWFQIELLYFYIIAFSVTLFNMMPIPLFDGARILRDLIEKIIGTKKIEGQKKKIIIGFDPSETRVHLNTLNITKILEVEIDLNSEEASKLNDIQFRGIDTIGDGFIDSIDFNFENAYKPKPNTPISVTVEYIGDQKESLKKIIRTSIYIFTTTLVVLNFIVSAIIFGNLTFWL